MRLSRGQTVRGVLVWPPDAPSQWSSRPGTTATRSCPSRKSVSFDTLRRPVRRGAPLTTVAPDQGPSKTGRTQRWRAGARRRGAAATSWAQVALVHHVDAPCDR